MVSREVNVDRPEQPPLWVVYGGEKSRLAKEFFSGGYFGVNFGLDNTNLLDSESVVNRDDLNPSVRRFLYDMKIGDHVLMPDQDRESIHYGTVASEPYLGIDGTHKHRRTVSWQRFRFKRADLELKGGYDSTVNRVRGGLLDRFNEMIKSDGRVIDYSLDLSWVPFHLDVARELIKGKWWSDEKRDDMVDLIQRLRMADPGGTNEVNSMFDPFNLYQAFCQRSYGSARKRCFAILADELGIEIDLPKDDSKLWNIPSSRRIKEPLDASSLSAMWDMFRAAVKMDPANDATCRDEFADRYNRVHSAGDRPEWRRILSTWLYLIDPTKYVHIDRFDKLGILSELGLHYHAVGDDDDSGNGYIRALVRANELAKEAGLRIVDLNGESTTREMVYPDALTRPEPTAYSIDHMLEEDLFFPPAELRRIYGRFEDKQNLILQGAPGVGKTFISKRLAYALIGERADDRIVNVQFHQSYSYEEFVQGYRPTTNDQKQLIFELQPGAFLRLCEEAGKEENEGRTFVMIIDEINRGNLSRVFGELLSLVEKDKRGDGFSVELVGGDEFSVPENVYILGTMNLADRSLTGMDYAMRRRFAFVTLEPQFGESVFEDWLRKNGVPDVMVSRINDRMSALNDEIARDPSLGRNFAVGHSYFCDIDDGGEADWGRWYRDIVETEIRPLLEEYWFDNASKADQEVEKLLVGSG